jgi:hypothetical protein
MLRYAVLVHDFPSLHWDLFLEEKETLRSWRLLEEPQPGRVVRVEALPPHRKLYLDYEGPVSGDRGSVARQDAGTYELLEETPHMLRVALRDGALAGTVVLEAGNEPGQWTVRFSGP